MDRETNVVLPLSELVRCSNGQAGHEEGDAKRETHNGLDGGEYFEQVLFSIVDNKYANNQEVKSFRTEKPLLNNTQAKVITLRPSFGPQDPDGQL